MDDPESTGDGGEPDGLACPRCGNRSPSVSIITLYHLLDPLCARDVKPNQRHGICKNRSCPVLYFSSNHEQVWETSDVRITVGFKQNSNELPRTVCYCFGYTDENIADEIEETGDSTVAEWISERVQAEECACEYKNPTGRCCLGDVRNAVSESME